MQIELTVGPLYSAVRQAAIVTSEESRGVDFTFEKGSLVLSGRTAEVGQSRIEVPVAYDGDKLGITLDPRYLIDFLKVLDPEKTFTLDLKDSESAAVCTTDDGYGYVIMPLAPRSLGAGEILGSTGRRRTIAGCPRPAAATRSGVVSTAGRESPGRRVRSVERV